MEIADSIPFADPPPGTIVRRPAARHRQQVRVDNII